MRAIVQDRQGIIWCATWLVGLNRYEAEGSGMGVAINKSIVESYGGHLWGAGHAGHDATFPFTLPLELVGEAITRQWAFSETR